MKENGERKRNSSAFDEMKFENFLSAWCSEREKERAIVSKARP